MTVASLDTLLDFLRRNCGSYKECDYDGVPLDNVSYYPCEFAGRFMTARLGPYAERVFAERNPEMFIHHTDALGQVRNEGTHIKLSIWRLNKEFLSREIAWALNPILIPPEAFDPMYHTVDDFIVRDEKRASIYTIDALGSHWSLHVGSWETHPRNEIVRYTHHRSP